MANDYSAAVRETYLNGLEYFAFIAVVVTGTDIRHVNLDECAAVLRKPIAAEQLVARPRFGVRSLRLNPL